MIKKVFFLTGLIILFLPAKNIIYASPFYTPSFRFIPAGKGQLNIKEIYTRENNFGLDNVVWRSDIEANLYYGINKNTELDLSLPYTSGGTNKQSGLRDSLVFFKYRIFSSQGYLLADKDLDIALQLGGRIRTGEIKKGLGGRETDVLCSLLGRYEIGKWKNGYFFYFHLGGWFPAEGDYKYKNVFQYDFAVECQQSEKVSFFLEGSGERTTDYNLVYIGPGIQFRPVKNWEMNFSFSGSVSDTGGFFNSKSGIGVTCIF
ncbi:MAG: transporter [bacterium]